jgi:predicted PurR-regulated permease PerM
MRASGPTREAPGVSTVTTRAHLFTFLAALIACLAVVSWMVGPYLLALFLGGTVAMLGYPAYLRLLARNWRPRLAAAAVTALMLLIVIAPLTGFSIVAVKQGVSIGRELADPREFSTKSITAALRSWEPARVLVGNPAVVDARLQRALQAAGEMTTASVLKLGEDIPAFLLQNTLALIAFFFFLLDGERFMDWLLGLGVLERDVQTKLVEAFRETTISAVLAGLAAAASLAVLITAGFLLLGVPGPFLAGGMTFIFAWIPVLGTAPALLAALLYLYAQGSAAKIALLVALGATTTIVDHMVRPTVLRGRAGMHPLVASVAIISGIRLFGILGLFIGPILAAMTLSLLKIWPVVGYRFGIDRRHPDVEAQEKVE